MRNKMHFLKLGLITMILMFATQALAIPGQEKARPADEAKPWVLQAKNQGDVLLRPGQTAYCHKDFRVTNVGKGQAEVQVIMGNGDNYYWSQIGPNQSVGYKLGEKSPLSTVGHLAENDQARIVNGTMGEGLIRVDCVRMK